MTPDARPTHRRRPAHRLRTASLALALAATAPLAACSGSPTTATSAAPSSSPGSAVPATAGDARGGTYSPGSDVTAHAAIGDDVAAIKAQLANAKDGAVDWPAVRTAFTEGGASKKGDGSTRTLQRLVDAPDVVGAIEAAIDGSSGGSEAVRAQIVEKGVTVLLHLKVKDELEAAAEKVGAGNTDASTGAPHNVDEAWAFYVAKGNGPQSTAKKRGDDFGKDVDGAILASLVAAQKAAGTADATAFATVVANATGALNTTFYLATHKYLDTGGDGAKQAEGETFFLAIDGTVAKADPAAVTTIRDAFRNGKVADGREALNAPAVRAALGIPAAMAVAG